MNFINFRIDHWDSMRTKSLKESEGVEGPPEERGRMITHRRNREPCFINDTSYNKLFINDKIHHHGTTFDI